VRAMADKVVLAFSGGLDTSFCVPYLREKGFEVITLFVDTGGIDAAERAEIERRAIELGAIEHVTVAGGDEVWRDVVVPLVMGGQLYQGQYPLLVSDRYVIVRRSLELARERGTRYFAHGCTGMGNDQVRFDLSVRALGDFEIIAPIRDIQREHQAVRAYEAEFLRARGFEVPIKSSRYTVNENLLGATMSGAEIDEWEAPGEGTYVRTAPPARWPATPRRVRLGFERGVAVSIDGEHLSGPALLGRLDRELGAYGVGRGIYTGDTVVGLKGRIVFEAPGLLGLFAAHRALEEAVLTREQNAFKPLVATKWVELVYRGFFYEPLKHDLERFLVSSQRVVTGEVTLEAAGGSLQAIAVESPHILRAQGAVYAQSADWGATEAEGFIRLLGQSSTLSAHINPRGGPGADGD
jgi:argininosuccinate synthase